MFQPWSRGAVGLKPSSLTWSTGHPVSHVHVGVASCAGFGYCFITEDLFWGVIWAVGDPQEQERKRAGWRRAERWDPAHAVLILSRWVGCLGHVRWSVVHSLTSPSSPWSRHRHTTETQLRQAEGKKILSLK